MSPCQSEARSRLHCRPRSGCRSSPGHVDLFRELLTHLAGQTKRISFSLDAAAPAAAEARPPEAPSFSSSAVWLGFCRYISAACIHSSQERLPKGNLQLQVRRWGTISSIFTWTSCVALETFDLFSTPKRQQHDICHTTNCDITPFAFRFPLLSVLRLFIIISKEISCPFILLLKKQCRCYHSSEITVS